MRLNNKIAIITGSASGFGKGIAEKFTQEGANLILVDINSKLLKKVSKNLSQSGYDVIGVCRKFPKKNFQV